MANSFKKGSGAMLRKNEFKRRIVVHYFRFAKQIFFYHILVLRCNSISFQFLRVTRIFAYIYSNKSTC